MPFPPPDSASASRGELAVWQVSVAVPAGASPVDLEGAVTRLSYLEARLATIDGAAVITLDIRATTHASALQNARDLVFSLLRGRRPK